MNAKEITAEIKPTGAEVKPPVSDHNKDPIPPTSNQPPVAPTVSDIQPTTASRGRPRLASADISAEEYIQARDLLKTITAKHHRVHLDSLDLEFEKFLEKKSWGEEEDPVIVFLCAARVKGLMWSSLSEYYDHLNRIHQTTNVLSRRRRVEFEYALTAERCLETGTTPFVVSTNFLCEALTRADFPIEARSFLHLLFLTGARPNCIFWVPLKTWQFDEEKVTVQWRYRKAQKQRWQRHDETYLYAWSTKPPQNVIDFLSKSKEEDWGKSSTANNIATVVNGWLKNFPPLEDGRTLTSSVFRDHMEAKLNELNIPMDRRKSLLDHTPAMSIGHYQASATTTRKRGKKK